MADVLTNDVTFRIAEEATVGQVPTASETKWQELEPNTIDVSGVTITTSNRQPIGAGGRLRKGVPTDQDSAFGLTGDVTWDSLNLLAKGISHADSTQEDLTFEGGVSATTQSYNLAGLQASGRNKVLFTSDGAKTLFLARGFSVPANNGLKVAASTISSGTALRTTPSPSQESASNEATIGICGVRCGSSDLSVSVNSTMGTATLTNSESNFDWADLGLIVGQEVIVGGEADVNRFDNRSGAGRVRSINGGVLVLDQISPDLVVDGTPTDNGSGKEIDILFGGYFRDVDSDHPNYNRRSFTVETRMPGIFPPATQGDPPRTGNEYSVGNIFNESTITLSGQSNSTMTQSYVGRDTHFPVMDTDRAGGAANNSREPVGTTAMSTAIHLADIRVFGDELAETTEFRECSITLSRNATPSKIIKQLSARRVNSGTIAATFTGTAILTSDAVARAIRRNLTASFKFRLQNEDGGATFSIHSMTLSNGTRNYTNNEEVTVSIDGAGIEDEFLGSVFGISLFPYVPPRMIDTIDA